MTPRLARSYMVSPAQEGRKKWLLTYKTSQPRLFKAADQLWTNSTLRPDQYAQPVLALIALRQMEAKFEMVHAELAPQFKGRLKPTPADYQARGADLPSRERPLLASPGAAGQGRSWERS